MLITLNAYCPSCNTTNERQVDEERVITDSEGNRSVRCYRCGGRSKVNKPKRHDNPVPLPDDTPHHEKNQVGGY